MAYRLGLITKIMINQYHNHLTTQKIACHLIDTCILAQTFMMVEVEMV